MKRLVRYAMAVMALACASCGNVHNLYPVSGTVTYKGKPAAGAAIFFRRQGGDPMNEHAVMGIVQENGSFTLICGSLGRGAPPGEYDVLIEWKQDQNQAKGLAHRGATGSRAVMPTANTLGYMLWLIQKATTCPRLI